MTARLLTLAALAVALTVALSGCRGGTKKEPQIGWIRNMHEVPRYDAQEPSEYFEDGRAMRPPVEGTLAREMEAATDPAYDTGVLDDGTYVLTLPERLTVPPNLRNGRASPAQVQAARESLTARGEERYNIYCAPCHGGLGDGNGLIGQRAGVLIPPTFHSDRLRTMPDGQIYATIRNGVRSMPAYRASIPVEDRWAIVAYVRALQLSQLDRGELSMLEGTPASTQAPEGAD